MAKAVTKVIGWNGCGVEFYFLKAKNIRKYIFNKGVESLFTAGTEAVYIPGNEIDTGLLIGHLMNFLYKGDNQVNNENIIIVALFPNLQAKVIHMASPTDIRKGRVIVYQGAPHLVVEMLHRTQGRQAGFVQTTLRNLQSGSTTTTKFRSTDNVEFMHTSTQKLEYSYKDADGFHFMDLESYEDSILSDDMIGDDECFLVEGNTYDILLVDGDPVRLELPASVEATVVEAPDALRGDTAGNVLKPVTITSGITIQVPLFIKKDDVIKISTSDRSYLGRV